MAKIGKLIAGGIRFEEDLKLDILHLRKCLNIYLYYLPFEALIDRDLCEKLCETIEEDLKRYILKTTGSARKNAFIFIITSSSIAGYTMDEKEISNEYAHISFLINSNASVTLINIDKDSFHVKECIKGKILEKLKLVESGYALGFDDNRFEYLLYNLRLQENNKLDKNYSSSGAHGKHITPFLYSNEPQRKHDTNITNELSFFFAYDESGSKKVKGMNLRILLIDDKIKSKIIDSKIDKLETGISPKKDVTLDGTIVQKESLDCKATLVKKLLELRFEKNEGITDKKEFLQNRVCWLTPPDESKETVCILYLDEFVDNKTSKIDINAVKEKLNEKEEKDKIQIIAVKYLDLARLLLSEESLRFDLVMMDYLLAEKPDKNGEREYATDFWGDGKEKYFEFTPDAKKEGSKYADKVKIYDQIKSNRGPMQRLWIFPITAFNQTFIDDLRNKGVRLIDYYWYLSRGADPINTPYLFIYTLNKFLQLQLQQAIFSMDMLLRFLCRSVEALEGIKDQEDFQAFMGAEYTVLIQKFGWRPVIYRDYKAGSLFAKYVWDNFYSRKSNRILFRLLDLIQKFYQSCAYGEINDAKEMRNNLTELKVYIIDEQESIRTILIDEKGKSELNVDGLNAFMKRINLIKPK